VDGSPTCDAKDEEVPVVGWRLLEVELALLREERGDVVIEEEENGEDDAGTKRHEDALRGQFPEVNEPANEPTKRN
jgi:hypothetical protein